MFEITQRGQTTSVITDKFVGKITYSARYGRFQVKVDNKLKSEGSLQQCINWCARQNNISN